MYIQKLKDLFKYANFLNESFISDAHNITDQVSYIVEICRFDISYIPCGILNVILFVDLQNPLAYYDMDYFVVALQRYYRSS